jgi:hypothetical protein
LSAEFDKYGHHTAISVLCGLWQPWSFERAKSRETSETLIRNDIANNHNSQPPGAQFLLLFYRSEPQDRAYRRCCRLFFRLLRRFSSIRIRPSCFVVTPRYRSRNVVKFRCLRAV